MKTFNQIQEGDTIYKWDSYTGYQEVLVTLEAIPNRYTMQLSTIKSLDKLSLIRVFSLTDLNINSCWCEIISTTNNINIIKQELAKLDKDVTPYLNLLYECEINKKS